MVAMGHEPSMMSKVSNIVDVYVGARLRMRRTMLGMSQSRLGELLGVTFQEIRNTKKARTVSAPVVFSTPPVCSKCRRAFSSKARRRIRLSPALRKNRHSLSSSIFWLQRKACSLTGRFCGFATPKCVVALSISLCRWRRPRARVPTKTATALSFGKSNKSAKIA